MIEILIFWLIAGILLLILSSLLYYYNTLGLIGFSGILLLGIVISILSAYYFWDSKRKPMGKPNPDSLKNIFTILLIISVLMFILGGLGYLLNEFKVYVFEADIQSNLIYFIIVGSLTTICLILSWIYVERNLPNAISIELIKQQHNLDRLKNESEEIGRDMKSRDKDVKDSLVDAAKISEKNRIEMTRR
ncbi:MAG: hypothetical protein FIB07_14445 [Candidatus Methanoperedens sp.]|nr:hypothetical protein [Candidatus Methanoperedens sp.]